jgi:hypothetical protein
VSPAGLEVRTSPTIGLPEITGRGARSALETDASTDTPPARIAIPVAVAMAFLLRRFLPDT